jgi:methyl-accepting chemotaxis protein
MNIRQKIQLSVLSAVAIPGIIISAVVADFVTEKAYEQFYDVSEREIRQVENGIEMFFRGIEDNVKYLINHPKIISASTKITNYQDNDTSVQMTPSKNGGSESSIFRMFKNFGDSHEDLAYVYFANNAGGYIQWPEGGIGPKYDPRVRPWYQSAMKGQGKVTRTSAYYFPSDNVFIISTVAAVKNRHDEIIGVQGMDVSLNGLTELVKKIKLGEKGYIMLLQEDGTILVDSRNPKNTFKNIKSLPESGFDKIANLRSGHISMLLNDVEYEVNIISTNALGWKFLGFVPKNEILMMSNSIISRMMIIEFIMLFIFIGASWKVARLITEPIIKINENMKKIALGDGDLTARINVLSEKDETDELALSFNDFIEKIHQLVVEVKSNAEGVYKLSSHVAQASGDLSVTTEVQSEQSREMSRALRKVSKTSLKISETVKGAEILSETSKEHVIAGGKTIGESIELMSSVASDMTSLKETLNNLQNSSKQINEIIKLITGIADQTNLLALNAAIEAARAGEAGRGFSVVADEVRQLSSRTTNAATQVAGLIQTIQSQSNASYEHISLLNMKIQESVDKGQGSLQLLKNITVSSEAIADETALVAIAIEKESLAIEGININIQDMLIAFDESTGSINNIKGITEHLDNQTDQLQKLVKKFKT